MPIFEYRCQECGSRFEKLVRRAEDAPDVCPSCGQKKLSQEFSTFAAHAGAGAKASEAPKMCPGGGPCNPGSCGMNWN